MDPSTGFVKRTERNEHGKFQGQNGPTIAGENNPRRANPCLLKFLAVTWIEKHEFGVSAQPFSLLLLAAALTHFQDRPKRQGNTNHKVPHSRKESESPRSHVCGQSWNWRKKKQKLPDVHSSAVMIFQHDRHHQQMHLLTSRPIPSRGLYTIEHFWQLIGWRPMRHF